MKIRKSLQMIAGILAISSVAALAESPNGTAGAGGPKVDTASNVGTGTTQTPAQQKQKDEVVTAEVVEVAPTQTVEATTVEVIPAEAATGTGTTGVGGPKKDTASNVGTGSNANTAEAKDRQIDIGEAPGTGTKGVGGSKTDTGSNTGSGSEPTR